MNIYVTDLDPFYTSLPPLNPGDKVGTLVKAEKTTTTVPGAKAWKIAYVSSDVNGNKSLVTGIVAAPVGTAPHAGQSWRGRMAQQEPHKRVAHLKFLILLRVG